MPLTAEEFKTFFQGRRILVTGAGGHLGGRLAVQLVAHGARVVILVRPSTDLYRLKGFIDAMEVHRADMQQLDSVALAERLGQVDTFFHLAAAGVSPQDNDARVLMETNVGGTLNALELARRLHVRRFVYCGSCFEYGPGEHLTEDAWPRPVSEYGASKVMGWVLANTFFRRYGLPVVSLRPFTLYGPGQSAYRLIAQVIDSVHNGKDIPLTGGGQKRDFIFIDDAVDAFLRAAMAAGIEGATFNVASGQAVVVKDVVAMVLRLMRARVALRWGVLADRLDEIGVISGDPGRAKAVLHWQARTGLEEGLRKTIDEAHEDKRAVA